MKKLLLTSILLSSAVFAIPPASEVRQKVDKLVKEKQKVELPTLRKLVEEAIDKSVSNAEYSTYVSISRFREETVSALRTELEKKGYTSRFYASWVSVDLILIVEWRKDANCDKNEN